MSISTKLKHFFADYSWKLINWSFPMSINYDNEKNLTNRNFGIFCFWKNYEDFSIPFSLYGALFICTYIPTFFLIPVAIILMKQYSLPLEESPKWKIYHHSSLNTALFSKTPTIKFICVKFDNLTLMCFHRKETNPITNFKAIFIHE